MLLIRSNSRVKTWRNTKKPGRNNFSSEKSNWKKRANNDKTIALNALKDKKSILLMFQNIIQIAKNKFFC